MVYDSINESTIVVQLLGLNCFSVNFCSSLNIIMVFILVFTYKFVKENNLVNAENSYNLGSL